jgi:hypothetical protein
MVVEKVDSLEHLGASELRGFCRISRMAFARIFLVSGTAFQRS